MTDDQTTMASLRSAVAKFMDERDWRQFHAPKNLSMDIAAEAAELMEHFLWVSPEASAQLAQDPAKRTDIADELADIVMACLQFANVTGIDVAAAVDAKLKKAALKYPIEKAKGRAVKYDEL
jgi:dCTP diphosphatase